MFRFLLSCALFIFAGREAFGRERLSRNFVPACEAASWGFLPKLARTYTDSLSPNERSILRIYSGLGHEMNLSLRVTGGDMALLQDFLTYFGNNYPPGDLLDRDESDPEVVRWMKRKVEVGQIYNAYAQANGLFMNEEKRAQANEIRLDERSHPAREVTKYLSPEKVAFLDSAIQKGFFARDLVLHRAVGENKQWNYDLLHEGDVVTEAAYTSCSLSKGVAEDWRLISSNTPYAKLSETPLLLEIHTPAGMNAAYLGISGISGPAKTDFQEVVLERNLNFEVVEKKVIKGRKTLVVRALPSPRNRAQ